MFRANLPRAPHCPQGVALAARTLGCKAVICMPTNSPEIKINAVKELGGIVELVGESFYEVRLRLEMAGCGMMQRSYGDCRDQTGIAQAGCMQA